MWFTTREEYTRLLGWIARWNYHAGCRAEHISLVRMINIHIIKRLHKNRDRADGIFVRLSGKKHIKESVCAASLPQKQNSFQQDAFTIVKQRWHTSCGWRRFLRMVRKTQSPFTQNDARCFAHDYFTWFQLPGWLESIHSTQFTIVTMITISQDLNSCA